MQRVKSLKAAIKYSVQEHKTNSDLITSYNCTAETIENDFRNVLDEYNRARNKNREISSRMIIQSFSSNDNLTAEEAHKYGIEFAQQYLKDQHQYVVVTHIETDNIHNHIIFNDINFEENKVFDSKRSNTINRLRVENHKLSAKYNLSQINLNKSDKKYIGFNEYVVRAKGKSFKENLEFAIDKNIKLASSYEHFLQLMKEDNFEYKQGKYLAFKNPNSERFIRVKTLGFNYLENSIKYRIEHKEYQPAKLNVINKKWIDKTQDKFKNNKALERWATVQNINYLNELNAQLYKNNMTLEEVNELREIGENLVESFNNRLLKIDDEIDTLENMSGSFEEYKNSYEIMTAYKSTENKAQRKQIKTDNNNVFRRYDIVKRNIRTLNQQYNIKDELELQGKLSELKRDRNLLYGSLNAKVEHEHQQSKQKNQQHDL